MKITISGKAGSGKDAIAHLLAKKTGFKFYSIGDLRKQMAADKEMTLREFNELGEIEDFTDKDVDEYQVKLSRIGDDIIVSGRLSHAFIPDSFKVLTEADIVIRAVRLYRTKKENFTNLVEGIRKLEQREESDALRYFKYYSINPYDKTGFNLVIDTTITSPLEAVNLILEKLNLYNKNGLDPI